MGKMSLDPNHMETRTPELLAQTPVVTQRPKAGCFLTILVYNSVSGLSIMLIEGLHFMLMLASEIAFQQFPFGGLGT